MELVLILTLILVLLASFKSFVTIYSFQVNRALKAWRYLQSCLIFGKHTIKANFNTRRDNSRAKSLRRYQDAEVFLDA